jgi:phosphoribosylformylglycinamidine synthase
VFGVQGSERATTCGPKWKTSFQGKRRLRKKPCRKNVWRKIALKEVRAIVLAGNGINCEMETAHACRKGGADVVDIVHFSDLINGDATLDEYNFLNLPGGFLDGDYLGAAKVGANRFQYARVRRTGERLIDQLYRFIHDGKLILGICNGFQLMAKLGILPGFDGDDETQSLTITFNDSGRFEDRWVSLLVNPDSRCVFTRGLNGIYLPVRHGEGKFIAKDGEILNRLFREGHVVMQYSDEHFRAPTMDYPMNPNGSEGSIAGITDITGRLFGLMPHPEAYLDRTNHPRWTREDLPEVGVGTLLFQNAVSFIRDMIL